MRLLYVSWFAAWAEALVSLPVPTRRLLPLRRAEEEQVDPNVREIVSAAMYGTPAEVAAKAIALSERVAASEAAAAAAAEGVEAATEKAVALVGIIKRALLKRGLAMDFAPGKPELLLALLRARGAEAQARPLDQR